MEKAVLPSIAKASNPRALDELLPNPLLRDDLHLFDATGDIP
jgi:hypothetical protein